MITADIETFRAERKDFLAFDIKLRDAERGKPDKRSEHRRYRTFQLKCESYNAETDAFEISDGIAHNCSVNGLYFETNGYFQSDEPVCLSSNDQSLRIWGSELVIGFHAQIAWCRLLDTASDRKYGVGVKYFEPIKAPIENP